MLISTLQSWIAAPPLRLSAVLDALARLLSQKQAKSDMCTWCKWNSVGRFLFNHRDTVLKGVCMVGSIQIEVSPAFGGGWP